MTEPISSIKFDFSSLGAIQPGSILEEGRKARDVLEARSGAGSDFLGWLDLPDRLSDQEFNEIEEAAALIGEKEELVVIGIGGSYLGARAVIEALSSSFTRKLPVRYAGHNMDGRYHRELLEHLSRRSYAVNVISKSGTTTEPGLAFRLLWDDLEKRCTPEELKNIIFATTDASKGGLRKLADSYGLKSFVIPDDVGGRYSVLTPVGLLPIAAAGFNIRKLVDGAREMAALVRRGDNQDLDGNPALAYACMRNAAYRSGKKIEIFASYQENLRYVGEWWKQLYGESEGKEGRGIFPASVSLTTDLHSMGQWIQEGERSIFETVLDIEESPGPRVPERGSDDDGLNYLSGRNLNDINRTALQAVMEAHLSGGAPGARLVVPRMDERMLGALLYMFEYACGISGYMLGVNPFDQPGVEAYKAGMFRLLGKPGHE